MNQHPQVTGGWLAMFAVAFSYLVDWVVRLDGFFHSLASILTAAAAALSIFFALKKHKKPE